MTAKAEWGLVGRMCVPFCEFMQNPVAAAHLQQLLPRAAGLMVVLSSISLISELPQEWQMWIQALQGEHLLNQL